MGKNLCLEGDEYDSAFFDKAPKFLHYHPDEIIITSLEFDHADIYADLAAIELQFRRLVNLVPRHGRIVAWGESETVRGVVQKAFCPVETFGFTPGVDWLAGDLQFTDRETRFRVSHRGAEVARVRMFMAGRHNVLNALSAIAIAHGRGVQPSVIEGAMATFRGVLRRLEVKGEASGVLVVDDFAHHPTAIRVTIEGARNRWPERRVWAVFEPRSNTMRRKVFETSLAASLSTADAAVLGAVNRAKMLGDEERLSPERVLQAVRANGRKAEGFESSDEIAEFLRRANPPRRYGSGDVQRQLRRIVRQTAGEAARTRSAGREVEGMILRRRLWLTAVVLAAIAFALVQRLRRSTTPCRSRIPSGISLA